MNIENGNPHKLSQPEWFEHIQQWESSGKSQGHYCRDNNLPLTTFGYWRTCYLKKQKPVKLEKATTFVPIKVSDIKPLTGEMIQAGFSSGLQLRFPLTMPLESIITLLKSLERSHAN